MKIAYTTHATATGGGRNEGLSKTDDGNISVKMTSPKELGGPGGEGTNPEQLFAMGYAACFLGALRFVAGKAKVTVGPDASVHSTVGLGPRDDGAGFGLDVALSVSVPGLDRAVLEDLIAKAHIVCPYSDATRNNLKVRLSAA